VAISRLDISFPTQSSGIQRHSVDPIERCALVGEFVDAGKTTHVDVPDLHLDTMTPWELLVDGVHGVLAGRHVADREDDRRGVADG
jgi:hypothetical protein